jgi:PTH1 family peptidyl-tRNA hydrolase
MMDSPTGGPLNTGGAKAGGVGLDGMAMIVGLGNPGDKYRNTRHNIGFDCLSLLHEQMGRPAVQAKFESQLVRGALAGRETCLVWPQTFMNCSGRAVAQVARFYKVPIENILVVCDDLSLPLGKLRLRRSGSSGGQKGLGDILKSLGSQDVPRLRIGIDPTPPEWDTADYVLSRFSAEDRPLVAGALTKAKEAIECWLTQGLEVAMNRFNAGR